ncbi:MAG: hypothetical protein EOO93_13735 [Pedobacter sp.]|nr:MAG: hypothetical protein EOO93_13735 [Pedobacter sp.]
MKKFNALNKSLVAYLLLCFIGLIVIGSCKKNENTVLNLNDAVNQSKEWFASTKINLYRPDWANAKLIIQNNSTFVTVPTNINYSSAKDKVSSVLIINLSDEGTTAGMAEFINSKRPNKDEDFLNLYNAILHNRSDEISSNYNGNVLLFTADRKFKLGWQTERGKVTGIIKSEPSLPNMQLIEKLASIDKPQKVSQAVPDQSTCEDHYWVVYNPNTLEIYSSRFMYSVCKNPDESGNSGGGSSDNNGDVTNKIKDPCIGLVWGLIEDNLDNKVTSILNTTFNTSDKINFTVKDGNISGGYPASTQVMNDYTENGQHHFDVKVTLNKNVLPFASQEYVATTIVHEIMHAYFDANKIHYVQQLEQHRDMAEGYVEALKVSVKEIYPSILDKDAYALALNGFGDIFKNDLSYWNVLIAKYNLSTQQIIDIRDAYRNSNSTTGTRCAKK